jgi:hypothetical protein
MILNRRSVCVATVLLLGPTWACDAQSPSGVRGPLVPDAVASEGFTDVAGLRELPDGRVLLVDPQERRIVLLGPDLALDIEIGRQGQGPGEFLLPHRLFPLRADTTAVVDRQNGRILLLAGASPLPRPIGPGVGADCRNPTPVRLGSIEASDGSGNLYFTLTSPQAVRVLRWVPGSCADTAEPVAEIPGPGGQDVGGGIILGGEPPPPLGPERAWAVDPAGRVAVVHPDPFQVEFTLPDGRRLSGPVIEYDPVPLTEGHREAWRQARARPQLITQVARGGGSSLAYRPGPTSEPANWLRTLPPFPAGGAHFAPDGTLWIQRWVEADAGTTFDLVNRDGQVVDRVLLPPGRRLVAFGEGRLYAVFRDEVDLEYVERYPLRWP